MCENKEKSLGSVTMPQRCLCVTLVFTWNDEFTIKPVKIGVFKFLYLQKSSKVFPKKLFISFSGIDLVIHLFPTCGKLWKLSYRNWKTPFFTDFIVNSSFLVKTSVTYWYFKGIVRLTNHFSWLSYISWICNNAILVKK